MTFALGFGAVIYTQIDMITPESFSDGTIVGILFAAVRTGVKAILEKYLKVKT